MSLFDAFGYKGKRALVVGGATGMGAAVAEAVRDAGAEVVVMDRAKISLSGVKTISIDLSEKGSIDAAIKELGGVQFHALFSCAGVADGTPGIERINFIGHRYMIDRLLENDQLPRGSAIGFISSAAGMGWEANLPQLTEFLEITDFDEATAWVKENGKADYMFSKQAICAYVAQKALPLLKRGVRINATLPGPTDTPLARANKDRWLGFGADYRKEANVEVSTAADQALPLVFLCSAAATSISGITVVTDIGFMSSAIAESFPSAKMTINFLRGVGGGAAGGNAAPRKDLAKAAALKVKPETRMLIDGKLVAADNGDTFTNINPATEEKLGEVANASKREMGRAIAAARRAFDETNWSKDIAFRKHCLQQLQKAIEEEKEELREQLILEAGCPRMSTNRQQLDVPVKDSINYPLELMDKYEWERVMPDAPGNGGETNHRRVWREPLGVVGAITPWNFPFEVAINKLAQALATGNTVVLKPAPDTPWSATFLGRLIAEKTDFPAGVVNIVTSSDHLVGEELTLSPDVDLISFTGSTAVGQRIMEKGAATLKRTFLELGGKSANIVLDDANLDTALLGALAVCFHSGQGCGIPTRMLVPKSKYKQCVERVTAILKMAPYGDPQRPDVMGGPLVSAKQRDRVLGLIEKAVAQGGKVAVGGGRPAAFEKGYYVEPTLIIDVDNKSMIAQEEIFGPVLCLIPFEDDDDAVRIANESKYGLLGAVNTASLERGLAVASRLKVGGVGINGGACVAADLPFGGFKASGLGRQNGIWGFDQYTETKAVAWPVSLLPSKKG
jgi:aldehyde dehydrogenase (NAD+)